MHIKPIIISMLLGLGASTAMADGTPFVNLTPAPAEMTVGQGEFTLPAGLTVSTAHADKELIPEIDRFITVLNKATGINATKTDSEQATITISTVDGAADGQYTLEVTANGVAIGAGNPTGLYYAFQTLRKILPANVMAEVFEQKAYALPLVKISDRPRMEYRGFMLDVSRHFFTVEEVKRMLDVMSYYKMNFFHWHLTDDQGWRIEMPQYPRLTTIGATNSNVEIVDMYTKTDYWLNKSYGPYFYTQDQLREVVAYAAERHITIIPEVEMPGHFSAVMAAYPEFSLNPAGGHSVAVTGGVYGDVMNVANPAAIKFAEDVVDVLTDIFPSELIHIGGDECPEGGWVRLDDKGNISSGNDECIAMYKKENLTHPRQLQSIFTKHMADYLAAKGRKIGVWNESITAGGTDENLIKQTDATVWCWVGAEGATNKATDLGLRAIYTPISQSGANKGSFYINRSQHPDDPPANGYKCDDVKSVYNTIPFTTGALRKHPELCYGVQGTFWCERVAYREYLEYLALPRLLAIAEIGWTPQAGKDWDSFQKRMSADRELLDYNDYKYSPYHMLDYTPATLPTGEIAPFEEGADYVFMNTSTLFNGEFLADAGAETVSHTASPWQNCVWTVSNGAATADNLSHNIKLTNALSGRAIASVGDNSGRIAAPVNFGATPAELSAYVYAGGEGNFMLSLNGKPLWLNQASGSVRAGETKNEGGVSPQQGASWQAVKVNVTRFVAVKENGDKLFEGKRGVPVDATDLAAYAPEIKNYALKSTETQADGTVNCVYEQVSETVHYRGVLANGTYVYLTEETVPLGEEVKVNLPEVKGFTLVEAGKFETDAEGNKVVISTYTTDAHVGVARELGLVTTLAEGKAYLIRDAHDTRNAFRCATASGTVNGAKSATGVSPMFTWTLEAKGSDFKVKNLATGQYVKSLERSTTAKLGTAGGNFTWTYDVDHWNVKGSNGMYWDGLDNLDLVGWNGGTGHPIEVYEFLGAPFFKVTVNFVDSKGKQLGSEVKYAPAGEPCIVGMPYRKNYTITKIEGTEALGSLNADAEVTITYTSDAELSISEINTCRPTDDRIFDLQGRRVTNPGRGIYIVNGQKTYLR